MSRGTRWMPALLAPVVVAACVALPVAFASASPNLPDKSAAQVLASISKAPQVQGYTGTIEQQSNLGLPDLSGFTSNLGASSSTSKLGVKSETSSTAANDALNLLTSDQKARVSYAAGVGSRVQLYGANSEKDVILTPSDLWQWDSAAQTAKHVILPQLTALQQKKLDAAVTLLTPDNAAEITPLSASEYLLGHLDSHTKVTVGPDRYVAGQASYTLVLTPTDKGSLVQSIQLAVDAKTGLPLQFSVYSTSQSEVAYQLGFTQLSYGTPAADTFKFTPATGVKVTTNRYTIEQLQTQLKKARASAEQSGATGSNLGSAGALRQLRQLREQYGAAMDAVEVKGSGWASSVTVPASAETKQLLSNKMLTSLTTKLTNGDQAIETALFTAVLHADGSISFGSVPVSALT